MLTESNTSVTITLYDKGHGSMIGIIFIDYMFSFYRKRQIEMTLESNIMGPLIRTGHIPAGVVNI